ncbi:MAG: tetratricopeptide repeat protein [Treponema sp.]|jgi:tetratricopeptide (TPR) repeat protein|nr:tetratricopeptide repeat protein [Treponema sp.]
MRKIPLAIISLAVLILVSACLSPPEIPGPGTPAEPVMPTVLPEPPAEIASPETPEIPAPVAELPPDEEEAESLEHILERVFVLLDAGDYEGALALFDLIDGEDAESGRILLLKASILCSAGRYPEAREITEAVRVREPENTEALLVLSSLEGALGREREQKAALERILKIDPLHVPALVDLGNLAVRGQNRSPSQAAAFFDQALAAEPDNPDALLGRAEAYRFARDPRKAEELLNRGIKRYPADARFWSGRAQLYRDAGFPLQALEDLNTARDLDAGDYWIAMDRGMTLVDLNRKPLALEEFTRAQSLNPDHFLSYVYTAGIKDEAGDYAGAEADYRTLVALRPDYYFGLEGLGMLLMRNHRWQEARDAFIQAYNLAPAEWTYALLGMMNWRRLEQPGNIRDFANLALRKLQRNSMEYAMIRLYLEMNGDDGVARRVNQEKDPKLKARMLYYLANYYDIKGNTRLAEIMLSEIMNLEQRMTIPEWRLVLWALEERNLAAY